MGVEEETRREGVSVSEIQPRRRCKTNAPSNDACHLHMDGIASSAQENFHGGLVFKLGW